jgi:ADP-ribosylglycohydrolase
MLGAIAGDIIGSVFEGGKPPRTGFPLFTERSRFTDDTVLTVAIGSAVRTQSPFADALKRWGRRYPNAGYGGLFRSWLDRENASAYGSFGNGSAMRVSAIGWAYEDLDTILQEAARSAEVTHNHPAAVAGAQAIAAVIRYGRNGTSKAEITDLLANRFEYRLGTRLCVLQEGGRVDTSCRGTVTSASIALLESDDFESAVRNAVSIGGDTDTTACIAGAMAEAFYGQVPAWIQIETLRRLDQELRRELFACAEQFGLPMSLTSEIG